MPCTSVVFEEEIIVRPFYKVKLRKGDYVSLFNAKLYKDALTRKHICYVSGKFCVYSNKKLGSRIRITDSPSGTSSTDRQLGWISISDIKEVQ